MKKRLLAMALVLVMAFTLLPASALAEEDSLDWFGQDIGNKLTEKIFAGKRWLNIIFQTADETDAGTDADVWIEITYEDGTYWGNDRDETPYFDHDGNDFDRCATDEYSILIPEGDIRSYRIVKSKGNDWLLDYVIIDGVKYDAPNKWLKGTTFFLINANTEGEKVRDLNAVFYTANETDAGTTSDVWVEIDYMDGSHWGSTRSETPYLDHDGNDFNRGATDTYTFKIPDKPIKSYKIVKDGSNDWKLFLVKFDEELYRVNSWLGNDAEYTITADGGIGSLRDCTVEFYTANEKDAGTDKDVWIEIEYEDGTLWGVDSRDETPYLNHSGNDFDRGATDTYTFKVIDKPIKKYTVRTDGGNWWLLDGVKFDGVMYAAPDDWLKDDASFAIEVGVTPQTQGVTLDIETGGWLSDGTDGEVYAIFYVKDPDGELKNSKKYYLNNDGNDFEKNQTDRYKLYGIPAGTILYFDIDFTEESVYGEDKWDLESVKFNEGSTITIHHTFVGEEIYRVFVDAPMVKKGLDIYTGDDGTNSDVRVKFTFDDGTETSFINLDIPKYDDFEKGSNYLYELYIPAKNITTITIKLLDGGAARFDTWKLSYFVFDGVRYSYGKTIKNNTEVVFDYQPISASNTGSAFTSVNTGMIIGIGVPVIVIAAAAVVLVLRKKKKNSADTAE